MIRIYALGSGVEDVLWVQLPHTLAISYTWHKALTSRPSHKYVQLYTILTADLQMSQVILSNKFDFYMMHVAKVSDHSYNIVNRNNQFKGRWFRSLQELRAATSRILEQCVQQRYEDVLEQWIHRHRCCVECEGHYFEK